MNLGLDLSLGEGYTSNSQKSRRITEAWAGRNLYCAACTSPRLAAHVNNRAVEDFHCPACARQVQLKAKRGAIPAVVSNSAYAKKLAAIEANRAPDYCFMGYMDDQVQDLLWVPGHFITKSVVARRKELAPTARRAGWVGSNILLHLVPNHGKIPLVSNGEVRPPLEVREQFQATAFLQGLAADQRGWVGDVLSCVDAVASRPGDSFTNDDLYGLDDRLARLHPLNQNIRPKIRQQLQVLVRQGVIERVSPGRYVRL